MTLDIKSTSPSGRFQVRVERWEARNSLWVASPTLWDTAPEETLFRFESEMWSLDGCAWKGSSFVELALRKYPGSHTPAQLSVGIDCILKTAEIAHLPAVPLDEIELLLDRQLQWKT